MFSNNFTDITKLILFHLQRLGAQHSDSIFNFWKIKLYIFFSFFYKILCFYAIVCGFVLYFYGNWWKIIFRRSALLAVKLPSKLGVFQPSGSKLWEKIHFLHPKVNFSGEEKTHQTHQYELCVKYIT